MILETILTVWVKNSVDVAQWISDSWEIQRTISIHTRFFSLSFFIYTCAHSHEETTEQKNSVPFLRLS